MEDQAEAIATAGDEAAGLRYRSLAHGLRVYAAAVQGEAYDALGDAESARLHYARFLRWSEEADPELEPWKNRARRAPERLRPDRRVE